MKTVKHKAWATTIVAPKSVGSMTTKGQVPKGVCRQRPLARRAAPLGTPVFSASCASATGLQRRLPPPSADRRWSRKDGEAARQGRAPHKDEPVRADPRDAGSHALHGQGAEPGRRHLRRSGWARAPGWEIRLRCDRPVRAGPGVRGPACSRTPGPSPALKPPLAGLILAPATPG